jgi:glycosyltransferase involved in cell wall biosynthesis
MQHPLVSIVIPLYNGDAFVERTLESVMAQTYENLEILVIDDGSTDQGVAIIRELIAQDPRIQLIQQSNGGVAAARNRGIEMAQGEFIGFIDADDLWEPSMIEKAIDRFTQSPTPVGVVYAWTKNINAMDQVISGVHVSKIDGDVYGTLLCHNFLGNASATVIRRACFDHVGLYDCEMRANQAQGCEDWDLYLRLAEYYNYAAVPELLVGYRKLEGSMSGDGHTMQRSQEMMLAKVKARHREIPAWYYGLSRSSFYLYLAHQGKQYGQPSVVQHWRQQALRANFWATLLRPEWYALGLPFHQKPTPNHPTSLLAIWVKVTITQGLHYILRFLWTGIRRSAPP